MIVVIIVSIFLFLLAGIPAGFAMAATSAIYFIITRGIGNFPSVLFAQTTLTGIDKFPLLAIPLFILMGQIMNESKVSDKLFGFAEKVTGHLPGGLGLVNILASMIFAGMSGSGTADIAGLGRIELKAMNDAGYERKFSAAITGASSLLGPIIPPSSAMIMYAIWANVSATRMLLAGLIPGLFMGLTLMLKVAMDAKKANYPVSKRSTFLELWESFKNAFFTLLTPIILLGGMLSGYFTVTESAAIAAFYSIILGVLIYKTISIQKLMLVFKKVAQDSAKIMFILAMAYGFSWVLTRARIPMTIANFMVQLTSNPLVLIGILMIFFLIMGCFLSVAVNVNLLTPIVIPIVLAFNIDPIFFGVIMVMCLGIGNLTPPFGIGLYVLTDVSELPYFTVVRALIPYILTVLIVVIVIAIFPDIATFLPNFLLK